ncbi:hypothetical protein HOLleu_00483 [Holothuria leucospilota]|uniref:Uncharacterized protein n=1 Tax=Holothuria leucospilota TaxID=206669 RepID=A0A9Q1CN35_HOLLE|nr:hypothetical protein HOLleu_00483 [Holothuria leucospilota]
MKKQLHANQFDLFDQDVVEVSSLEAAQEICNFLNVTLYSSITVASRVVVYGCEFRIGSMIMLLPEGSLEEDDPFFSQIIVLVEESEVYFLAKSCETSHYERHFHAHYRVFKPRELLHFRPLHATQSHIAGSDLFYIPVQYRNL